MRVGTQDERVKQVVIAAAVLATVTCGVVALLLGWRKVPGVFGEWLGMLVGIMSTPFFLEASFVVLGVLLVLIIGAIRRHREGDDFVSLDELQDRDQASLNTKPPPSPARPQTRDR